MMNLDEIVERMTQDCEIAWYMSEQDVHASNNLEMFKKGYAFCIARMFDLNPFNVIHQFEDASERPNW